MPSLAFDERVAPERVAAEAFRWLCDATRYVPDHLDDTSHILGGLWTVLRTLAAHPQGQSEALRRALGTLIVALMASPEPQRSKVALDLSGLFVRVVDSHKAAKYEPMKHVAIAGIGFLAKHTRNTMPQMATNFFVVVLETLKLAPVSQLSFRHTCLWALAQCAQRGVGETTIKSAFKVTKSCLMNADETAAALSLLTALVSGAGLARRDSFTAIFQKSLVSTDPAVRIAGAHFYAAVELRFQASFRRSVEDALHLNAVLLVECLLEQHTDPLLPAFEQWLGEALLKSLGEASARRIVIGLLVHKRITSEQGRLDTANALLRLLATGAAPMKPTLGCLQGLIGVLGDAVSPVAPPMHQALLSLLSKAQDWTPVVECTRALVDVMPGLLLPTISACIKQLESEATTPHAYLLATMVGLSSVEPLYGAVDINRHIIREGTAMITVAEADSITYSVGWTLVGGAMALGPRIIKPATAQLLRVWEAHLPRLANHHVHLECALTGLAAFMAHNRALVTPDVALRIGTALHNVWRSSPQLTPDTTTMIRRLLQCYDLLSSIERSPDIYPASLLTTYVNIITDPDCDEPTNAKSIDWSMAYSLPCGLAGLAAPSSGALANDVGQLLIGVDVAPPPAATAVLDLIVSVVAKILPLQPVRVQESVLNVLRTNLENAQRRNRGVRRFAVAANLALVVWHALSYAERHDLAANYSDPRLAPVWGDIIRDLLQAADPRPRRLAAQCYGMLARIAPQTVNLPDLLDQLVVDLEPDSRGARALAIGYVVEGTPRAQTSAVIDRIFTVLERLALDPNEIVHLSVLEALRLILSNSEPIDVSFVKRTLRAAVESYLLESHASPVARLEIARILALVVSTLGPDVAERKSTLSGVLRLVDQFQRRVDEPELVALSWRCLQELYYYARSDVSWPAIVHNWCEALSDPSPTMADAAVSGLRILFELSATSMLALAGPDIEPRLWLLLDREPYNSQLRDLLSAWLRQTAGTEPAKWVERLRTVLSPSYLRKEAPLIPKADQPANPQAAHVEQAEEDETLDAHTETAAEPLGWEARVFAIELLHNLIVTTDGYVHSVGDVIKIAFSAATSPELAMQVVGLRLLTEVIRKFGRAADLDYPDAPLLDQYQMQLTSALTPAFGADSTPRLALAALDACAELLMFQVPHRILHVLEGALKSLADGEFHLGKLDLSPNAAQVLRVAVLRVWARASLAGQSIVEKHSRQLISLWFTTLRQYALLRFEPEDTSSATSFDDAVTQIEDAQLRQVVMPTYGACWLDIVAALADSIDSATDESEIDLMVLFGLCCETLIRRGPKADVLQVLSKVLEAPGGAELVYKDELIFGELTTCLRRCALAGTIAEQRIVVKISKSLALSVAESDENVDHLFELVRVALLPLRALFPEAFGESDIRTLGNEELELATTALDALIDIVLVFRDVIQNDLWVSLLRIFEHIMRASSVKTKVAVAPSFRRMLESLAQVATMSDATRELVRSSLGAIIARALDNSDQRALHTCMLIVTTAPEFAGSVTLFAKCASDYLVESETVEGRIAAARCIQTVLKTIACTAAGERFAYTVLPRLVVAAADVETPAEIPPVACNAMVAYGMRVPTSLAVIVPALVAAAQSEVWSTTERRVTMIRRMLLSLVVEHPQQFKSVVHSLDSVDSNNLQAILVETEDPAGHDETDYSDEEAEITLTSFA